MKAEVKGAVLQRRKTNHKTKRKTFKATMRV